MPESKPIQLSGLSIEETAGIIPSNTILLGYMGSMSHNTYVPNDDPDSIDDKDIMGACVADENQYIGFQQFYSRTEIELDRGPGKFEQQEVQYNEWDSVVYEVRKFFYLLLKQNPNVLGLLWLKPQQYIHISEEGEHLISSRELFMSKECYHSFVGYAHGQLHRMTHQAFQGYMGAKRKRLVEKHGYDTKNASHLIRILRMGIEYLTDGILRVHRTDSDELKAIKRGEWTLEKVQMEADRLFALAQDAYIKSPLPLRPQHGKIEALLMSIIRHRLYGRW